MTVLSRGIVGAVILAAAPVLASPIAAFSGNTQPYNGSTATGGTVNFAAYTHDGVAGDVFKTGVANFDALLTGGSGALDTSAAYLYLFQSVNNAPGGQTYDTESEGLASGTTAATSYGYVPGASFSQAVLGTAAGFGDPSGASTGASPSILTGVAGLNAPVLMVRGSTSVQEYFAGIAAGQGSTIWGYTSNLPPALASTAIVFGGNGLAVTALPEPASLGLLAVGATAVMGRRRRSR